MIAQLVLAAAVALARITVQAPDGTLSLEVADTFETRAHGLMDRTVVAPRSGMIFVFRADDEQYFWMKDTLVPLDMIFVASDGTISSVAANVPPSTRKTKDADVARRSGYGKYVIELRAGEAGRAGLHAGVKLDLPKLNPRS